MTQLAQQFTAMRRILCARVRSAAPDTFVKGLTPCDGEHVVCGWCDNTVRMQAQAIAEAGTVTARPAARQPER